MRSRGDVDDARHAARSAHIARMASFGNVNAAPRHVTGSLWTPSGSQNAAAVAIAATPSTAASGRIADAEVRLTSAAIERFEDGGEHLGPGPHPVVAVRLALEH